MDNGFCKTTLNSVNTEDDIGTVQIDMHCRRDNIGTDNDKTYN